MFYKTNMVNLAEKFKLSPKFFLISRKVTFFCGCDLYFNGKSCVTVCFLTLVQYVAFAQKNQKNRGKNFY